MQHAEPIISFFRLIPGAPDPCRADRAAGGLLPMRGARYCDPLTSATANGWWVFPPTGFALMWDGGTGVFWTYEEDETWYPLKVAQFPDFAEYFAKTAPDDCGVYAPPVLTASIEPGIVQVWSGWIAHTRPGWSALVRPPANLARQQGFECYEGIIETDSWFGPLFINLRLNKTDTPIYIRPEIPLLQVTPVLQEHYSNRVLDDVRLVREFDDWTDQEWGAYRRTVVEPNLLENRQLGLHAASVRRRRKRSDSLVK